MPSLRRYGFIKSEHNGDRSLKKKKKPTPRREGRDGGGWMEGRDRSLIIKLDLDKDYVSRHVIFIGY